MRASDKFPIGGDACAAAGPMGRTGGGRQDLDEDRTLSGHEVTDQLVPAGGARPPAATDRWFPR